MNKKKLKYLFLGYGKKKTNLINFLEKKKIHVKHLKRNLKTKDIKGVDLVISFGYKHILQKKILNKLSRPALNLHISYLPYNRGAHPNFWSFIKNTPKGVSIHEINEGIDTGNIVFRKKVSLDINSKKFLTFKRTYNYLIKEVEKLFIKNYDLIKSYKYTSLKQSQKKTFYKKAQLPKLLKSWDTGIKEFKKLYFKNHLKK